MTDLVIFAVASEREALMMNEYVDYKIRFKAYTEDSLMHIRKKHSIHEEQRGQKNINNEDIELLKFLTDADAEMNYAGLSNQNHSVKYIKKYNGFEYHVVMVAHRRSQALILKTMYAKIIS